MMRFRNKVIAVFLLVVGAGILGATLVTTRLVVKDKHNYVMELNSIAAPNVAAAIGRHLDYLQGQLVVFDDILLSIQKGKESEKLLQSAYQKLSGVEGLEVMDAQGLVAAIGAGSNRASVPAERVADLMKKEERRVVKTERGLAFASKVRNHLYLASLNSGFFAEDYELARALEVALVSDDGTVIGGSAGGEPARLKPELVSSLVGSLKTRDRQSVIAREMESDNGQSVLAAISPVPATAGLAVLVLAPATQVTRMIAQISRESIPFVMIVLIVVAVIGVMLSAQVVKPIEELTDATSRIASGNWKVDLKTRSSDEIGTLVESFAKMGEELAQRETALRKANEDLLRSETLATLGKFSAGLAHEVKNPLNAILGYAQLIQMKWAKENNDETFAKYLSFIMDETRRASKIITDLLTFARQKPPALAPMRLKSVLEKAGEMLALQAAQAKAALELRVVSPEAAAEIDSDQIYQVLLNLVQNSFQAMEENPEGKPRNVILRLEREGEWAVIRVEDTGPGIRPENLSRLFEPFFSTKGVGKGTGLGLSMCHGIVNQHKGRIEVSSTVGEGTCFKILLPAIELRVEAGAMA